MPGIDGPCREWLCVRAGETPRQRASMRDRMAYLHYPKSAGISIGAALSSNYEPDETVPWYYDHDMFAGFDRFESIQHPVFLGEPSNFRGYRFMQGHWTLPSIMAGFGAHDVACILREPRSPFLSQYTC